jgi:hypothetical protein
MQNCSLRFPSPDPGPNPRQFLDGDPAPGAFGFSNDLLGNTVVHVFGEARLFACQLFQSAVSRFRLSLLKCGAQSLMPMSNRLQFGARVLRTVAIAGDLRDTKIHPQKFGHIGW